MHLTDGEKQQLKALIDADEPLPARYRASLFAGRTKRNSSGPARPVKSPTSFCPFT